MQLIGQTLLTLGVFFLCMVGMYILARTVFRAYFRTKAEYVRGLMSNRSQKEETDGDEKEF